MDDHFTGSPFHPKVIDPRKVRISGGWAQYMDGNERVALVVGEEKRLVFDVSQAGPGKAVIKEGLLSHLDNCTVAVFQLKCMYFKKCCCEISCEISCGNARRNIYFWSMQTIYGC
jgi:hypothetical protein